MTAVGVVRLLLCRSKLHGGDEHGVVSMYMLRPLLGPPLLRCLSPCAHQPGTHLALCLLPGEAYDKVARLLGLELKPSGGAALEAFAREGDPHALLFSVPMQVGDVPRCAVLCCAVFCMQHTMQG